MILLDTNVLSELMKLAPDEQVVTTVNSYNTNTIFISAITHAEILQGLVLLPKGKRKQQLQSKVQQILGLFTGRTLPFTHETSPFYADIIQQRTTSGRPIDFPDAQIAAIAIENQLTLFTRNTRDFENISSLQLTNPWN
jgi:predicted nucleic acid-binding protein